MESFPSANNTIDLRDRCVICYGESPAEVGQSDISREEDEEDDLEDEMLKSNISKIFIRQAIKYLGINENAIVLFERNDGVNVEVPVKWEKLINGSVCKDHYKLVKSYCDLALEFADIEIRMQEKLKEIRDVIFEVDENKKGNENVLGNGFSNDDPKHKMSYLNLLRQKIMSAVTKREGDPNLHVRRVGTPEAMKIQSWNKERQVNKSFFHKDVTKNANDHRDIDPACKGAIVDSEEQNKNQVEQSPVFRCKIRGCLLEFPSWFKRDEHMYTKHQHMERRNIHRSDEITLDESVDDSGVHEDINGHENRKDSAPSTPTSFPTDETVQGRQTEVPLSSRIMYKCKRTGCTRKFCSKQKLKEHCKQEHKENKNKEADTDAPVSKKPRHEPLPSGSKKENAGGDGDVNDVEMILEIARGKELRNEASSSGSSGSGCHSQQNNQTKGYDEFPSNYIHRNIVKKIAYSCDNPGCTQKFMKIENKTNHMKICEMNGEANKGAAGRQAKEVVPITNDGSEHGDTAAKAASSQNSSSANCSTPQATKELMNVQTHCIMPARSSHNFDSPNDAAQTSSTGFTNAPVNARAARIPTVSDLESTVGTNPDLNDSHPESGGNSETSAIDQTATPSQTAVRPGVYDSPQKNSPTVVAPPLPSPKSRSSRKFEMRAPEKDDVPIRNQEGEIIGYYNKNGSSNETVDSNENSKGNPVTNNEDLTDLPKLLQNASAVPKRRYRKHVKHYTCDKENCGKKFNKKGCLLYHSLSHIHSFKCHFCDLSFTNPDTLARHEITKHPPDLVSSPKDSSRHRQCPHCLIILPHVNSFPVHFKANHLGIKVKLFSCPRPQCNAILTTTYGLHAHMSRFHKVTLGAASNGSRRRLKEANGNHVANDGYTCFQCEKPVSFKFNSLLKKHQREKHGLFHCNTCPRNFPSIAILEKHQQTVHAVSKTANIRVKVCNLCVSQRTFKTLQSYKNHQEIHHSKRITTDPSVTPSPSSSNDNALTPPQQESEREPKDILDRVKSRKRKCLRTNLDENCVERSLRRIGLGSYRRKKRGARVGTKGRRLSKVEEGRRRMKEILESPCPSRPSLPSTTPPPPILYPETGVPVGNDDPGNSEKMASLQPPKLLAHQDFAEPAGSTTVSSANNNKPSNVQDEVFDDDVSVIEPGTRSVYRESSVAVKVIQQQSSADDNSTPGTSGANRDISKVSCEVSNKNSNDVGSEVEEKKVELVEKSVSEAKSEVKIEKSDKEKKNVGRPRRRSLNTDHCLIPLSPPSIVEDSDSDIEILDEFMPIPVIDLVTIDDDDDD